jgi:hypothetical protein
MLFFSILLDREVYTHVQTPEMNTSTTDERFEILSTTDSESKICPVTYHRYTSSTLSLTSALDGDGWSEPGPDRFIPGIETRYSCIGGWVGPRAGLDRCGKSRLHRDSIPGSSSP